VLVAKAEQEKAELMEAHAMELAGVKEELDKETQDYMDNLETVNTETVSESGV
jgi:hypothetical protein